MDLSAYNNRDFDRGASRLKEIIWYFVKMVFFLTAFPWPSGLKAVLLRMFGARIGESVVIRPRVNITFPWRLNVGDHVWIGEEVLILSLAQVTIGSNVCISQRAFLCTGSHDHTREDFALITKPITIHDESWIAASVFVGAGVTVEPKTVVSAGTVLT